MSNAQWRKCCREGLSCPELHAGRRAVAMHPRSVRKVELPTLTYIGQASHRSSFGNAPTRIRYEWTSVRQTRRSATRIGNTLLDSSVEYAPGQARVHPWAWPRVPRVEVEAEWPAKVLLRRGARDGAVTGPQDGGARGDGVVADRDTKKPAQSRLFDGTWSGDRIRTRDFYVMKVAF